MASSAAADSDGEVSSVRNARGQQSPIASQRAREQGDAQARGRFPLGYKDGFNQWVSLVSSARTRFMWLMNPSGRA